jgi:hypothetical protein
MNPSIQAAAEIDYLKLQNRIKRLMKRISNNKEYSGYDVKQMLYDVVNPSTK